MFRIAPCAILVSLGLFGMSSVSVWGQGGGDRWAVLVGAGQYQDTSINPLPYSPGDAKAFRDLLLARGGFEEDHIALLVDGAEKEFLPTRANILDNSTG